MRNPSFQSFGPCLMMALAGLLTGCPASGDPPAFVPGNQTISDAMVSNDASTDASQPVSCTAEGEGQTCETGLYGICNEGISHCNNGVPICTPLIQRFERSEDCNGKDDNCDGETDEGLAERQDYTDLNESGICAEKSKFCRGGEWVYEYKNEKSDFEICGNGKDDDCDGYIDEWEIEVEGVVTQFRTKDDISELCFVGKGVCKTQGEWVCGSNGKPYCDGEPNSAAKTTEICNGKDDDCNGETDEGFEKVGEACTVCLQEGRKDDNHNSETANACDSICTRNGKWECNDSGEIICVEVPGQAPPVAEQCDGVDNDCDGDTDEGFAVGLKCNDEAVCDTRTMSCDADHNDPTWVCKEPIGTELCDGVDNDCDGAIDEDFPKKGEKCPGTADNPGIGKGACYRVGVYECNEDHDDTICSVTSPGSPTPEIKDEIDNDCDGLTDEGIESWNAVPPVAVVGWEVMVSSTPTCQALDKNAHLIAESAGGVGAKYFSNEDLTALLALPEQHQLLVALSAASISDEENSFDEITDRFKLEWMRAGKANSGELQPLSMELSEYGTSKYQSGQVAIADNLLKNLTADANNRLSVQQVPSPLFYDSSNPELSLMLLNEVQYRAVFSPDAEGNLDPIHNSLFYQKKPYWNEFWVFGVISTSALNDYLKNVFEHCKAHPSDNGCKLWYESNQESINAPGEVFTADYALDSPEPNYVSLCMKWTLDASVSTRRPDLRGGHSQKMAEIWPDYEDYIGGGFTEDDFAKVVPAVCTKSGGDNHEDSCFKDWQCKDFLSTSQAAIQALHALNANLGQCQYVAPTSAASKK